MTQTKYPRKERLMEKVYEMEETAEDLQAKANEIRGIVERGYDSENIPRLFNGNSDDYRRLLLNNERLLGIKDGITQIDVTSELTDRILSDGKLSCSEAYNVIYGFSKLGDPLCELLIQAHKSYQTRDKVLEGFWLPNIAKQLLSRKGMTETEYNGYNETLRTRIEKLNFPERQ